MIRLNCSNCGQKIKTDDKYAGKRVRCPNCKEPLQIPQAEGRTRPSQSAIIKFRCPNCDQKIGVPPSYGGKVVRCAKCKHRLRVPQPHGAAAQPKPQDDLAVLKAAQEQPAADEGGMPGLGDMNDLLQLEASAPAVEDPLQLSPLEEPAADSRAQDYTDQFPTRPSYQADGGEEKKKNKLVVPIVIAAVCIVVLVIGYVVVSSFMSSFTSTLDTVESQAGANYDEAKQFTRNYISLLADGDIEAAIEILSPDVKAAPGKDQIETLAKLIGTSEIVEMKLGPIHYEQDLESEHYYLWYTLNYDRDVALFIASVRQVDEEFTIDGIALGGSLGSSVVIGPLTELELTDKAMKGIIPEMEEIGAIGALVAKSFCGIMVVILIIVLIQIISMWVLFEKAGQPGWAAIIPFYNIFVLAEIGEQTTWVAVGACFGGFIPIVGAIVEIACWIMISVGVAKTFERSVLFGIGLFLLPFIFYPILAFSRD